MAEGAHREGPIGRHKYLSAALLKAGNYMTQFEKETEPTACAGIDVMFSPATKEWFVFILVEEAAVSA
jgi:hypothetical protein